VYGAGASPEHGPRPPGPRLVIAAGETRRRRHPCGRWEEGPAHRARRGVLAGVVGEIGRLPMVGQAARLPARRRKARGVTAFLLRRWRNASGRASGERGPGRTAGGDALAGSPPCPSAGMSPTSPGIGRPLVCALELLRLGRAGGALAAWDRGEVPMATGSCYVWLPRNWPDRPAMPRPDCRRRAPVPPRLIIKRSPLAEPVIRDWRGGACSPRVQPGGLRPAGARTRACRSPDALSFLPGLAAVPAEPGGRTRAALLRPCRNGAARSQQAPWNRARRHGWGPRIEINRLPAICGAARRRSAARPRHSRLGRARV